MAFSSERRRLAGMILALALVPSHEAVAHGVSLELHHPLPAESAFHREFLAPWIDKVEAEAGGRMRFHPHAASTLGGKPESLHDQARDGATDVVWAPVRATADRFPALSVFEFPFMVRTATGGSRAVSEYARINDLPDRDFDGTRVLAVHVGDPAQLHWVRAPEGVDLGGRRVAVGSPLDGAVIVAMGGVAVETEPSGMADALKSGSADGALLSWSQAAQFGVDRVAKAHTDFGPNQAGVSSTVYVFAMSSASYRSLPDDLKAVVSANSGAETAAWLGRVMDAAAARARKGAAERGEAIRVVSPEERDKWRQAGRSATEARARALEQGGIKVKLLLESAREQLNDFDKAPK